jgi:hypothetical protein
MTNRDPLDAWLGGDVEPLPPPPGAFERVHRRARRRKAVRAGSAAAGAAVIVAAVAILPQVAHGLLSGPTAGPAQVRTGSASTTPGGSSTATATSSAGQLALKLPLWTAGKGPVPAAGFHPVSVTFVGTGHGAVIGAALGQAGSCGTRPCMVMAGTPNYGAKWTEIGAPRAGPADGPSGVSQVRFLNPANGWVYGPALYATHDGGRNWRPISYLPGRVIDLSTVGRRAFAVLGINCSGTGSDFAANCARFSLFSAPARGGTWRPVPGASGKEQVVPGALQLTARVGYLIAGGRLYTGPVTTGAWHEVRAASPTTPSCLTSKAGHEVWLIAPDQSALYLACGSTAAAKRLDLYVSVDGGQVWRSSGTIPVPPATARSLAVSPGGTLVLATTAGIYRSSKARSWLSASLTAHGGASLTALAGGFGFVGMTTDAKGVAVPANPGRAVFVTTDGGRTWRQMPITR